MFMGSVLYREAIQLRADEIERSSQVIMHSTMYVYGNNRPRARLTSRVGNFSGTARGMYLLYLYINIYGSDKV